MYKKITDPLHDLVNYYDVTGWWIRDNPLVMLVEAILIQNTNNKNVSYAISNLTPYLNSPDQLLDLPTAQLAEAIKPSGFFHVKAVRLKHFLEWFKSKNYDYEALKHMDGSALRKELLAINGIGPETADDMLLYAFNHSVFIADKYARRFYDRLGFPAYPSYQVMQADFIPVLTPDYELAQNWHAAIVTHCQTFCTAKPNCHACPLLANCQFGQTQEKGLT